MLKIPAAWQERYVRKMIDTIIDLDNVLYQIANEMRADTTGIGKRSTG